MVFSSHTGNCWSETTEPLALFFIYLVIGGIVSGAKCFLFERSAAVINMQFGKNLSLHVCDTTWPLRENMHFSFLLHLKLLNVAVVKWSLKGCRNCQSMTDGFWWIFRQIYLNILFTFWLVTAFETSEANTFSFHAPVFWSGFSLCTAYCTLVLSVPELNLILRTCLS